MPSLLTCNWLEGALRTPLERQLDNLHWLFAESDLDQRIRSRLPVINAGWIHEAGRIGLPTRRSPWQGFSLATRSLLIEAATAWRSRGRPAPAHVQDRTVLPEDAVLGERYELVLSSPLGFLRFRSNLHVRVVGFMPSADPEDNLPRPRVLRLRRSPPTCRSRG